MPKHTKSAAGEAQETPTPTPDGAGAKRTAAASGAVDGASAIARGRPVAERKKKYLEIGRAHV